MKRFTVVGTGFGGLTAVSTLRKLEPSAEITVIGKKPEFFYYPSLIWIPSGIRSGDDLTVNLENFFRRKQVVFHQGAATGIRYGGRVVETDNGEVGNDGLIIASGGRYLTKLPGIEHAAIPCRGLEDAERIRDRLNEMDGGTIAFGFGGNPREPSAMRGGPVFEFLFGTDTLLRRQARRDRFRLVFFAPSERPGQRLGEKAVDALLKRMSQRGIATHLGHKLKGFESGKVLTEAAVHGSRIPPCPNQREGCSPRMRTVACRDGNGSMWPATPGASPAPTGNPSRHIWQTCRQSPRRKTLSMNSTAGNRWRASR